MTDLMKPSMYSLAGQITPFYKELISAGGTNKTVDDCNSVTGNVQCTWNTNLGD